MAEEIWRPVPGFESYYEVSDLGRVKSCARSVLRVRQGVDGELKIPERILKPRKSGSGYFSVHLYKDGLGKNHDLHRLVLLAFMGHSHAGEEGCHNDRDKSNNRLSNLRYDTPKNNHADKYRHGTALFGEKNHLAGLNDEVVMAIRALKGRKTMKEIGEMFGVRPLNIANILAGRTWSHLGGFGPPPKRWKISDEQAEAIRQLTGKEVRSVTAKRYGVTKSCIQHIQHGRVRMPPAQVP
jgi:hypothetical protein